LWTDASPHTSVSRQRLASVVLILRTAAPPQVRTRWWPAHCEARALSAGGLALPARSRRWIITEVLKAPLAATAQAGPAGVPLHVVPSFPADLEKPSRSASPNFQSDHFRASLSALPASKNARGNLFGTVVDYNNMCRQIPDQHKLSKTTA
jgi:hypothetical protein